MFNVNPVCKSVTHFVVRLVMRDSSVTFLFKANINNVYSDGGLRKWIVDKTCYLLILPSNIKDRQVEYDCASGRENVVGACV